MRRLPLEERLEQAASLANLAMLRTYSEPSRIQIQTTKWLIFLLESELRTLPQDDSPTRRKVSAQLDISRSIIAPIRRLPVELLSFIFSLAVEESPLRIVNIAASLSHVCIAWRKVARGHAALWTTVVVETPNDFDGYCELFLPLTREMLLDLRCDHCDSLQDLWDRIAPYASRWRRITLEAHLCMLPDLKVLYMEKLERLVVFAYDAPTSSELSVLDFVVAPRLTHIALTVDTLQSERQLHVPVARALTSLFIEAMTTFSVAHTVTLLRACADTLQSLTIKIRLMSDSADALLPTNTSNTFLMQALTRLSLVDPACALLDHLTAPLTQELVLSTVPAYGPRSLLGFLTRSRASRQLRKLRVYDVEERDPAPWIPCLQLMENLKELHFDDLLSNLGFIKKMTRYENRPPLLPALEAIAIWHVFWDHLELQDDIGEMFSSRDQETTENGIESWKIVRWIDVWPDP
ncbi:hypothetical protein K525DRAFT_205781 [Schizophyllum commune Loenen D]|nr:hypothetical protein K525DRAFT_205781 [Schizophyllum commune Loenen D]